MLLNTISICFLAIAIVGIMIRMWKLEISFHVVTKKVISEEMLIINKKLDEFRILIKEFEKKLSKEKPHSMRRIINSSQRRIMSEKKKKWWQNKKNEEGNDPLL